MNLINKEVTHKVFGEGSIVDHNGSIITISFNEDVKKFVYPDAFRHFIKLNDKQAKKSLNKILLKKEKEEEEQEREREKERQQQAAEQHRREIMRNHQIHESSQIVFWLDQEELQNVFTDWNVFAGTVQSGENKGQPRRVARLHTNSASLLTARESDQPEEERRILGLYMVNETFSGELNQDGIVPSHEEFRIELTEQEAEKMLFWNYYINNNHPHRMTWNSGKFRYFNNIWTAQILKDIIDLRTDEEQIKHVKSFLEYFCQMNALDIEQIPEANGALKQ